MVCMYLSIFNFIIKANLIAKSELKIVIANKEHHVDIIFRQISKVSPIALGLFISVSVVFVCVFVCLLQSFV